MPKAQGFSPDDDEEKTTIESGWEEEASTTVEQGDVAEKLRTLGAEAPRHITHITSTNGALDELTVDDQRAHAAIAMIAPTPAPAIARLVITQGNDTGQELAVSPGKSYTIGRAIDNDFVLTDIAVSRKHFDLRDEAGAWVLADRGSGNGTVVNGAIEDQPFLLANGDLIEIGNTTFRFDLENGAAREANYEAPSRAPLNATFDVDVDEEEPSTVAGKPIHDELVTPAVLPPPVMRPKTVPPPAPLPRPRTPSAAPNGYGAAPQLPQLPPQPIAPLVRPAPMPLPIANRMPVRGAQAPTMLAADAMAHPTMLAADAMVRPQLLAAHEHNAQPLPSMLPTTIPGQGPPVGPAQPQMFGYPNVADMAHQQAQLHIHGSVPRDATSTALVQPAPYGVTMMPGPATYVQPQLSRRTKMMLGGAALAMFAAIATIAIIKGSSAGSKVQPTASPAQPTVESINEPSKPPPVVAKVAKTEPTKTEPTKTEPTKTEPANTEPARVTTTEPAKTEPARVTTTEPTKTEPAKITKTEPAKVTKTEPAKITKTEPKKETRAELRRRLARERTERERAERAERATTTSKRVTTIDVGDVKTEADRLYRNKKFKEAEAVLVKAGNALGGSEGSNLKSLAGVYKQVGSNYYVGMGQATKAGDAYMALTRALNHDRTAGGAFVDEIQTKLAVVASRAAVQYMAEKDYVKASKAAREAERLGGGNSSTKIVRSKLEERAGELYAVAIKELDSNPASARTKFREIKSIVDAKNSWHQKASKALNGG